MKTVVLCWLIVLTANDAVFSQTLTFYKSGNGQRYTQGQMDSLLAAMKEKSKKWHLHWTVEVTHTHRVGDTLLQEYKLNGKRFIQEEALVSSKLPDFSFKDKNGKAIKSGNLQGKPFVLNLWFTTCAPCLLEIPDLNTLKTEYATSGISFWSMTFDGASTVSAFLKKHKFDFPVIIAEKKYLDNLTTAYPMTLFIDKRGIIKHIATGAAIAHGEKISGSEANMKRFREGIKAIQE